MAEEVAYGLLSAAAILLTLDQLVTRLQLEDDNQLLFDNFDDDESYYGDFDERMEIGSESDSEGVSESDSEHNSERNSSSSLSMSIASSNELDLVEDEEQDDDPVILQNIPPVELDLDDPVFDDLDGMEDEDLAAETLLGVVLIQVAILTLGEVWDGRPVTRGPYKQVPRSMDWLDISLQWTGKSFHKIYRMSPATFWAVVKLLEPNPIFRSRGSKPQRPVKHQFACFLLRFGREASRTFEPVTQMAISEGSVINYCRRVTRALRELGLHCIAWPNEERKQEISKAVEKRSHIPGCIGIIDGSLIQLAQKPSEQGDHYICRKGWPAVNILGIVDHQRRLIAYEGGWPGCKADISIFKMSHVWLHRGALIARNEFLLADKGYALTPYVCRPYAEDELGRGQERRHRKAFNRRISRSRVFVEHAFGLLKARFRALRNLGPSANIQDTHRSIEALIVLHNLCIDLGDKTFSREGKESEVAGPSEEDLRNVPELDEILPGHLDHQEFMSLPPGGWDPDVVETVEWHKSEGRRARKQTCMISANLAKLALAAEIRD